LKKGKNVEKWKKLKNQADAINGEYKFMPID
jgi:hypothetical protein